MLVVDVNYLSAEFEIYNAISLTDIRDLMN